MGYGIEIDWFWFDKSSKCWVKCKNIMKYNQSSKIIWQDHSVHHPPFLLGVWTSYQIFKKGGLTGPQLWEGGVAGKEGANFFSGGEGGCNFTKKN